MWFTCFPVLPDIAKANVICSGIVKRHLIAYFIGSISAKNIKIRSCVSQLWQAKGGTFLRHGVDRLGWGWRSEAWNWFYCRVEGCPERIYRKYCIWLKIYPFRYTKPFAVWVRDTDVRLVTFVHRLSLLSYSACVIFRRCLLYEAVWKAFSKSTHSQGEMYLATAAVVLSAVLWFVGGSVTHVCGLKTLSVLLSLFLDICPYSRI